MSQLVLLHRDDAYQRIRDLVVSGEVAADVALSERTLAETLGLGRTPVREALKALAKDGLLTIHPMRGTFVRQLSFDDLREIHEMRLGLEGLAAFLAASRGPSAALKVSAAWLRALECRADLDVEEAQQAGWTFHDELFRAAGNGRLVASYDGLRAQSGLALQKMRKYSLERTRRAVVEHLDIYAAVEAGDATAAQQRMWRHLSSAFEARLAALGAVRPQTL
ncbi:MAG: GntR family transcriptional regulator [Phreatobacter sp.]